MRDTEWLLFRADWRIAGAFGYLWGTIAFIALQKTKKQPIILRNPTEELQPRSR